MTVPGNLQEAMQKWQEVYFNKAGDKEISKLGDEINLLKVRLDRACEPFNTELQELEEYIKAQVMELGQSIEHSGVKAAHRKGHERVSWNNKEMSSILLSNPNLAPIFTPARKVTEVKPSVSVKWVGIKEETPESVQFSREDYEVKKAQKDTPF